MNYKTQFGLSGVMNAALFGRSFQIKEHTNQDARRCLVAKRARGTKSVTLVAERITRRAATSDTGLRDHS